MAIFILENGLKIVKKVFLILFLFLAGPLHGQQTSDEYERAFAEYEDLYDIEAQGLFENGTDAALFSYPRESASVFDRFARRNFRFVSYYNRGYDGVAQRHYLENIDISSGIDIHPDYLLFNILRMTVPRTEEYSGAGNEFSGASMGAVLYRLRPSLAPAGISLRAEYSEQLFRGGGRLHAAGDLGGGWKAMVDAHYRAGRDRFAGGVFTESGVAAAGVERDFGHSNLAIFALGGISQRGVRMWTVKEVYELTGDNLYNPSWGLYGSKQRNSAVKNDKDLLLAATYKIGSPAGNSAAQNRPTAVETPESTIASSFARHNNLPEIGGSPAGMQNRQAGTEVTISLLYRRAERGRSGLAWQDGAPNPMPDHYTDLPSYFADPFTSGILADMWADDKNIRLLDWDNLLDANRYGDGALYIIGRNIRRIDSFHAAFSASSRISESFTLGYGARLAAENNTFFRVAGDMLGGGYFYDRSGEGHNSGSSGNGGTTEGSGNPNDPDDSGRIVFEGGRFGYDFDIPRLTGELYLTGKLMSGSWRAGFDASLRGLYLYREGRLPLENQLQGNMSDAGILPLSGNALSASAAISAASGAILPEPGNSLQGRSEGFRTLLWDAKLYGRHSFSRHGSLSAVIWAGEREPAYRDIFFDAMSGNMLVGDLTVEADGRGVAAESPAVRNFTNASGGPERALPSSVRPAKNMLAAGAELSFNGYLSPSVALEAAAYYTHTWRGETLYRYWDDIRSEPVVMQLYGIERTYTGVQAALSADITSRLSASGAFSFGRYVYARDAEANIYRRSDMELLSHGEKVHIRGLVSTPSPQLLFAASVRYAVAWSWSIEASCVYAGRRYVSINPARRSNFVLDAASSPETRADFMHQEELPAAFALNLGLSCHLRLFGRDVYAGISVNNLLGRKDMVYGGYEQMRTRRSGEGIGQTFSPFPSRYAYCYPRTIYASLSINL